MHTRDSTARPVTPRATYRLQLHAGFDFAAAAGIADYLAALGVSHVYCSPYVQAAPGSTHGYDVVDPQRVNSELGGPVAHQHFSSTLGDHDLGQVLDVVPNHMAIGGSENPWWWDVLENGPGSRYARFFDVEWESIDREVRASVLLPVLGDHYGRVLEAGELCLARERGSFVVRYAERSFPVAPSSMECLLVSAGRTAGSEELVVIGESLGRLPDTSATDRDSVSRRHRGKEVFKAQLSRLFSERPEIAEAVDAEVDSLNRDPDRLDDLIQRQNYRLAFWRAAGEDLDYRRFFDVTSLVGLRTEDEHVFNETHELIVHWLREGLLDGLRVDHPDGLRDPKAYFERLHNAAPGAWLVAEKILEPGEELRADWPVAGTTGYDFLNEVARLYVDPAAEAHMTALYDEFRGEDADYPRVAREAKEHVLRQVLGAELNRLSEHLLTVARGHRLHRDYTRGQIRAALRELIACFPVYRTYVRAEAGVVVPDDERRVNEAVDAAANQDAELPRDLLDFIADILLLRVSGPRESEFVMRFQQLTGPVMAKGVEDTAFYRYNRLVSLNEVGGDPGLFGNSVADFHAANRLAQRHWPGRMVASSTHDTKRSEDVRIRISLLSEMSERWTDEARAWQRLNRGKRVGEWPDGNTEYLVYQTLVGAWPIEEERIAAYLEKAVREAKVHTSWIDPNRAYEDALRTFVSRCFEDSEFTARVGALVEQLKPSWHATALAQTLLKLTSPGVPDIYQGTELWELSLVDPDNRRPVDYQLRRRLLERAARATAAEVMADPDQGLPKLWLIHRLLSLRARRPELLGPTSSYAPIEARGARAGHVVAFARGGELVAVAPRLLLRLAGAWRDTSLTLPDGTWEDELTGQRHNGGDVPVADLLAGFPVALLMPVAM